ncbi:MAG: DUF1294 domain-containing protein [Oscillospiraceae bacterium]|nr:DUF1294 domain-containing protein [Clostridia bacterium]MBQ3257237.1 DUF1294 domain-containing protein [Oscillospiraceae bacterium]
MEFVLLYFVVISAATAAATFYDKLAAKAGRWRVPEKTLLLLALVGGAAAELAVMLVIRHKTRHKKFMIGLPAILVLQAVLIAGILLFL